MLIEFRKNFTDQKRLAGTVGNSLPALSFHPPVVTPDESCITTVACVRIVWTGFIAFRNPLKQSPLPERLDQRIARVPLIV